MTQVGSAAAIRFGRQERIVAALCVGVLGNRRQERIGAAAGWARAAGAGFGVSRLGRSMRPCRVVVSQKKREWGRMSPLPFLGSGPATTPVL